MLAQQIGVASRETVRKIAVELTREVAVLRNIGLDERFVERWTRRPVPRYRVREETRPRVSRGSGSDVWMYRPVVRETPPSRAPRDVAAPTPAAPDDAEMRTRRAANRRAVEAHWENERRRLEAEQRREDQQPGAADEKRRRHEEEMRALEEQKQRDVKVMESRQDKNLVRGRKEKKDKGR